MQSEWDTLTQTLSDTTTDWKKREAALKRLEVAVSTGTAEAIDALNRRPECIAFQLSDLRSSLVKLASEVVQSLATARTRLRAAPDRFIDQFARSDEAHRALASANKIIATHAADALNALARTAMLPPSAMLSLTTAALESKSAQLRERVSQLMVDCLEAEQRVGGFRPSIEQVEALRRAAEVFSIDASGKTRQCGRAALQLLGKATPRLNEVSQVIAVPSPRVVSALAPPPTAAHKNSAPQTRLEFRALLREYQSASDEAKRLELADRLQRTEIHRFGEQFLPSVLVESRLPPAVEDGLVAQFPLSAFIDHFLSQNTRASLTFLRRKLDRESEVGDARGKLVDRLLRNVDDAKLAAEFRRECAAVLEERLAAARPPLRADSRFNTPSSARKKRLMRTATPEITSWEGLVPHIERLHREKEDAPRGGYHELMRLAEELAQRGATIDPVVEAMFEVAKTSEDRLHTFFELALTAFASARDSRDALVKRLLGLPCKDALVAWVIAKLARGDTDAHALAYVLRLFTSLLRLSHSVYEGAELEGAVWPHIDHFAKLARSNLICHTEVNVRKSTVGLLVEAQRFLPAEVFAEVMVYFSPEQQRLVQHFLAS